MTEQEQEQIPITDELHDLGVTDFVKQGDLVQIIVDRHKVISFNIHKKEFSQTMNRFRESALNGTAGLSRDNVKAMELILVHPDNDYVRFLQSGNGNGKQESNESGEEENIAYATAYAFENELYEAAIIGGSPCFLKVENNGNGKLSNNRITISTEVELTENDVLLPLPQNLYMSRPYVFKSDREFNKLVEIVKHETLDSLYQKVKARWNWYIDNGEEHNIMCTGDTIFIYFQDKLGMTHYDFFIGGNGVAKTNNLFMLNLLAYRNTIGSCIKSRTSYCFNQL